MSKATQQAMNDALQTNIRYESTVKNLGFYIGNLRYALAQPDGSMMHARERDFNRGRLEAFEDALQMLTGSRGEDIQ